MDTLSIAPANVCSQSRSGGDGVNLSKYTNVNLFFFIAYVFFYVYTCVHISMFFFIIYSGFVSSLKNSKLLPRKRPSPITITKLA